MRQEGSSPRTAVDLPVLPLPVALAVVVLGVLAMTFAPFAVAWTGNLRLQVALGTVLLVVPALLALSASGTWRAALGLVRPTVRLLAAAAGLGAALWVASVGLMELQSLAVPPTPEYLELFRRLHHALAPSGPLDAVVSLVVIAALPGLCEELLVRGALLPSLAAAHVPASLAAHVPAFAAGPERAGRPLGDASAVVASSILFAAMHLDAFRFLFTLSVGLALGWVRLRTGSLWPSVIAHVTLNALTFLVAPLVDDPQKAYTPEPVLGVVALVLGLAATWPLLRALRTRAAGA